MTTTATTNGSANGKTAELLSRLTGVRLVGKGKWEARCPAHEDNRASLSVTEATDGTLLIHCHANCATTDVLGAMGMKLADLFLRIGHANGKPRIVATYDYRDADGNLLFQAVRFEPKDFRQRQPNGDGWTWSVKGCAVVPYRLPELLAADPTQPVFVVEGEKDVDRLRLIGLTATCNAGGAGKWKAAHSEYLTGRHVAILPDNDAPGRQHAEQVAKSIVDVAGSVKLVELPGLPDKGDVSDWLASGGTAAKLNELVEAAPEWGPSASDGEAERGAALQSPARRTTDVGNAERFAEQHGADVRFCHPWGKWLVWDGKRWAIDESGEVMRRAKRTARQIYVEASRAADKFERESLGKWAAASERRERLAAMIVLAQSEQPIPIAVEALDSEAWIINVENGTLNLRTGELREHRREDYLTKLCPVEYPPEPGVDPDLWLSFLDRIFAGNARLIQFLQRLVGMALVGEVLENILVIFHGIGANGKSVGIETLCGMLGSDYAMSASTSLLMVDHTGRHPTERTDLHGKRLVAANESGDGGRLSEETVKLLTSREKIRARRMREDNWEFTPSHSVILATNHKPEIRGTDYGIWRRIHLIPFSVIIPPEERDKELANKLRAEWPAILRWAVAGCLDWQRNGLQAPPEVRDATDDYRAEQDVLGEWIEERCITGPDCEARSADLYRSYRKWAEDRGERPFTQTRFGIRLTERGFTKLRQSSGHVCYCGVGLLPEGSGTD